MSATARLDIALLGELELSRDGRAVALPKSRKTRALLAYLLLNDRPISRDQLCTLFWDLPDDPRGALRWSLSKLRPLLNDAGTERLQADRHLVRFSGEHCQVDWLDLQAAAAGGFAGWSRERLADWRHRIDRELLAGLDLPDCPDYQAWLTEQRTLAEALRRTLAASSDAAGDRQDSEPVDDELPSIAVLAFENMSADPNQEYVSDGIAEDLITALSRVRVFRIIARNSSFTYKGRRLPMHQIGRELGARYVIDGSVRAAGGRVRITVQLFEAAEDRRLWGARYDRNLDDVFALQDEITETLIGAIEPELSRAEAERAHLKPPQHRGAWDCINRAFWLVWQMRRDTFPEAHRLMREATEIDPTFARGFAALAASLHGAVMEDNAGDPERAIERAVAAGRRAVELDDQDAFSHFGLGRSLTLTGGIEQAVQHFERALALNPSYAWAHHGIATPLRILGRHEEAIAHEDQAIRLSPRDPMMWTFLQVKAHALYHLERYEEAEVVARRSTRQQSAEFWCWSILAASLAKLGRLEEARAAIATALEHNPAFNQAFVRSHIAWREEDTLQRYLDGLAAAGLPEL